MSSKYLDTRVIFLVVLKHNSLMFYSRSAQTIRVFEDCLKPLMLTHEMSVNDTLRFWFTNIFIGK